MSEITVHGSGYVGLAAAAGLAEAGFSVTCVEIEPGRLAKLQQLQLQDLEADDASLARAVRHGVEAGRLQFVASAAEAKAPWHFICVGTPAAPDGEADLGAVWQVTAAIARHADEDPVVFVKSTVPPGTCARIQTELREQLAARADGPDGTGAEVISNPEFLRQGSAADDFRQPARVMLGVVSDRGRQVAQTIYERLPGCRDKMIFSDPASAELAKYACNAFLATRVAMINDFALLADRIGGDIEAIRHCVGADPRIGTDFLAAGPGFGGSCFGKDLQALEYLAGDTLQSGLFGAVLRGNDQHRRHPVALAQEYFDGKLEGLKAAVWGLTFKAGTADMRDSPAIDIISHLRTAGVEVTAFDPVVSRPPVPDITLASDALSAATGADMLLICTDWPAFTEVDFAALQRQMRHRLLVDCRNLLDPEQMQRTGFDYRGTGRRA